MWSSNAVWKRIKMHHVSFLLVPVLCTAMYQVMWHILIYLWMIWWPLRDKQPFYMVKIEKIVGCLVNLFYFILWDSYRYLLGVDCGLFKSHFYQVFNNSALISYYYSLLNFSAEFMCIRWIVWNDLRARRWKFVFTSGITKCFIFLAKKFG